MNGCRSHRTALNNNRDLRLAALNVERARAMYGSSGPNCCRGRSRRQREQATRSGRSFGTSGSATVGAVRCQSGRRSWEIDFFGRIRSLKDRALEEYLATEQARRSAQILLVSAVANAYLTLAADRENLKLAQSTLERQQAAYDLIQRRFEVGLAPELDLRQAQTQVDAARGDVARYTQLVAQDENALNLLVGSPVPADLLPEDLSVVSRRRRSPPACPPRCSCAGRTFSRRRTCSRRPTPISAPPGRLSSPAFP